MFLNSRKRKIFRVFLVIVVLIISKSVHSQSEIVTDHKGTKIQVNNNVVTIANVEPTDPVPLVADFWFDIGLSVFNNAKIWTGSNWRLVNDEIFKYAEFVPTSDFGVNTSTRSAKDFFAFEVTNDGAITQTSPSLLTVNEDGLYLINFNCRLTSSVERAAAVAIIYINGVGSRIDAITGYIRSLDGHNASSWNFSHTLPLNENDRIEIHTVKEAQSGNVLIINSQTSFTITKIRAN